MSLLEKRISKEKIINNTVSMYRPRIYAATKINYISIKQLIAKNLLIPAIDNMIANQIKFNKQTQEEFILQALDFISNENSKDFKNKILKGDKQLCREIYSKYYNKSPVYETKKFCNNCICNAFYRFYKRGDINELLRDIAESFTTLNNNEYLDKLKNVLNSNA